MPYCCRCGKQTRDTDAFCGVCGAPQPVAKPAGDGINSRTASMLCYVPVLGWIPAVIALASQRFRQDKAVRFHAFQGIFLFVVYLIIDWFLGPVVRVSGLPYAAGAWRVGVPVFSAVAVVSLLKLAVFIAWIFMLAKTAKGEQYHLPILGELAERSVAEQK